MNEIVLSSGKKIVSEEGAIGIPEEWDTTYYGCECYLLLPYPDDELLVFTSEIEAVKYSGDEGGER